MILADTSVWVDHFRRESKPLTHFLNLNRVLIHPLVIGELACGNLKNRQQILSLLKSLNSAPTVDHEEALYFLEKNKLMGKGVGFIDIQLLASTALDSGIKLWSYDKRLNAIASDLGLAWSQKT